MIVAASRTPRLCSKSPSTWMKAALTLVLLWSWLWPWDPGDWCRINAILKIIPQVYNDIITWKSLIVHQIIKLLPSKHLQDIYHHSTARRDEHDVAINFIVITDDPLDCNEQQYSSHYPNGQHWKKATQNLCGKCVKNKLKKSNSAVF